MEKLKRVNNSTWVCNELEKLIEQYEKELIDIKEESEKYCYDEFMEGQADMLKSVINKLKELLYTR